MVLYHRRVSWTCIKTSNIRTRHICSFLVQQHPLSSAASCRYACNYVSICSTVLCLTSEAEEGEEVLRLGLAPGQVLNGRGQG